MVSRVLEYNLQEACICVYLWLKCSSRDSFANITRKEERLFDNRASFKLDELPEFKRYKFDSQLEISWNILLHFRAYLRCSKVAWFQIIYSILLVSIRYVTRFEISFRVFLSRILPNSLRSSSLLFRDFYLNSLTFQMELLKMKRSEVEKSTVGFGTEASSKWNGIDIAICIALFAASRIYRYSCPKATSPFFQLNILSRTCYAWYSSMNILQTYVTTCSLLFIIYLKIRILRNTCKTAPIQICNRLIWTEL